MKIFIGSNNKNKIKEIKDICNGMGYEIINLMDENIFVEAVEDGQTIEENSFKKANAVYKVLKEIGYKDFMILSDDTGLMVEYLNGAPGVLSARFSGENSTYEENNDKLLKILHGVEYKDRGAKFLTVLTLMSENGEVIQFSGSVKGKILNERRGENGFGYDSIFYLEDIGKTFGELKNSEKNVISHRYNALVKFREYLIKKSKQ